MPYICHLQGDPSHASQSLGLPGWSLLSLFWGHLHRSPPQGFTQGTKFRRNRIGAPPKEESPSQRVRLEAGPRGRRWLWCGATVVCRVSLPRDQHSNHTSVPWVFLKIAGGCAQHLSSPRASPTSEGGQFPNLPTLKVPLRQVLCSAPPRTQYLGSGPQAHVGAAPSSTLHFPNCNPIPAQGCFQEPELK